MSYYIEINLTIKLRKDTPIEVIDYIEQTLSYGVGDVRFDDHPFFDTRRWYGMFWSMGYDDFSLPYLKRIERGYELHLHTNINHGSDEVLKFVDWISPFILGRKKKTYLGYKIPECAHQRTNIYWNR
jgi:hypothetical protein